MSTEMIMKPTVHYTGKAARLGDRAYLKPVDHPNHLPGHDVTNTHEVFTSTVLEWDEATGRIETRNTIYVPVVA